MDGCGVSGLRSKRTIACGDGTRSHVDRRQRLAVAANRVRPQVRAPAEQAAAQRARELWRLVAAVVAPVAPQVTVQVVGTAATVAFVP